MKIDSKFNPIIGDLNVVKQKPDVFDLDISTIEIAIAHPTKDNAGATFVTAGCTIHCPPPKTARSICLC